MKTLLPILLLLLLAACSESPLDALSDDDKLVVQKTSIADHQVPDYDYPKPDPNPVPQGDKPEQGPVPVPQAQLCGDGPCPPPPPPPPPGNGGYQLTGECPDGSDPNRDGDCQPPPDDDGDHNKSKERY